MFHASLMRMKLRECLLLFVLTTVSAVSTAQVPATSVDSGNKSDPATWNKDADDALTAENNHEYATAYSLYKRLLSEGPPQRNILMQAAIAARGAGHPDEALSFYQQGSQLGTVSNEIPELIAVVPIYSALGRWEDFDKAKARLRQLAAADSSFAGRGYLIDEFTEGSRQFRVLEFPNLTGRFNSRYRFLVVSEADPAEKFIPYYDLESDDADQAFFKIDHPKLAAKGERRYSLDSYPKPRAQALMGFYDGEPTYETLRAIVAKSGEKKPLATDSDKKTTIAPK